MLRTHTWLEWYIEISWFTRKFSFEAFLYNISVQLLMMVIDTRMEIYNNKFQEYILRIQYGLEDFMDIARIYYGNLLIKNI